jgi:hypothetical protein
MSPELRCANCDQRLDPTDKFCRECGLPTVHRSEAQRLAAAMPPNADEFKRAMDVVPNPTPFIQAADQLPSASVSASELATSSVVKVTNPTFAAQMAGSTWLLVGAIVVLVAIGIALIVLALRF